MEVVPHFFKMVFTAETQRTQSNSYIFFAVERTAKNDRLPVLGIIAILLYVAKKTTVAIKYFFNVSSVYFPASHRKIKYKQPSAFFAPLR